MYYSYLAATTWRMRCIFLLVRCIFLSGGRNLQNEMCILSEKMYTSTDEIYISIWRPPDISGGCHLQNEMYVLSEKMYISTGEMYMKYTSFHLKYTSHSLSGGRQIGIIHLSS